MSKTPRKDAATPPSPTAGQRETSQLSQPAPQVEILVNGVRVEVPPELEAAVQRAYRAAAQPLPREMTTNQAADFLDVSRPFIIKLVRRGELPCRMVGKHRRIPTDALLQYREKMFQRAKAAVDEMTRIWEELGSYGQGGVPPKGQ